jgi:hypothetical protein
MGFRRDAEAPISATLLMKYLRDFKTILILERNKLNMRCFITISCRVELQRERVSCSCLWRGGGAVSGG